MRNALLLCMLMANLTAHSFAADDRVAIGFGYVHNQVVGEKSDDLDGNGLFGVIRLVSDRGFRFNATLSFTNTDDTAQGVTTKGEFLRFSATVGPMFRREMAVRPFLHFGIAYVVVDEASSGIQGVQDSSLALSGGVGLEVGEGPHGFYANLSFDFGHKVDVSLPGVLSGESKFDLRELHLGYLYRF